MPLDDSLPMRVTPIMYMTNEDGGLDTVKLNENFNKIDGLKVIRLRGKSYYEQFEFAQYPERNPFVMQARHDINYPLWNMMYYFVDNLRDLLFEFGINDYDPRFIMARFDETTTRKQYIVSYNKKRYDSYNQARADSQLFNGNS
jgi:hypothetical protein